MDLLDIRNAKLFLNRENKEIPPMAVYTADADIELDCLLYKKNDLKLPLASSEIHIPEKTKKLSNSDNPQNWKCIKYVFNIPTPDPLENFSLIIGSITERNLGIRNELIIYFSPRYIKTLSTH